MGLTVTMQNLWDMTDHVTGRRLEFFRCSRCGAVLCHAPWDESQKAALAVHVDWHAKWEQR